METRDVRRTWEDFHRDGVVSSLVRPAVLASWRRSSQHQIAVTQPETTVVTEADFYRRRQQHRTFLHAARPAMEKARELLASANSMTILTDPTGTVLETVGDARAMVVAFGRSGALIYSTEKALREIERRNPNVLAGAGWPY